MVAAAIVAEFRDKLGALVSGAEVGVDIGVGDDVGVGVGAAGGVDEATDIGLGLGVAEASANAGPDTPSALNPMTAETAAMDFVTRASVDRVRVLRIGLLSGY